MGPAMWIGLWDPERDDDALVEACAVALERAGARLRRTTHDDGRATVVVEDYPALCPPGVQVAVQPSREAPNLGGGLVELVVPLAWFQEHPALGPAEAWARFRDAIERLLADVQPLLVACPVELGVGELPEPDPADADGLFRTGWVNPDRLDPGRREAFDRALGDGPRTAMAGGWWWSADPDRDPARRGANDAGGLSAAIYTAWTGQPAAERPAAEPAADDGPLNEPQLWLWAADRDDDRLLAEVRAWAEHGDGPGEVELGTEGAPGWFPVIVALAPGTDPATGLAPLRRAVAAVKPSWAALLPESGLLVPGVDPEIPAAGALGNVWVRHGWIGGRLDRLLRVLDGAHREELAGGTLVVTDPGLHPEGRFADWCRDPEARWDRVVEAAAVLGEAARASRQPP